MKKKKKVTSWIDQKKNNVPFSKRLGAYILDWAIGGVFTGLPAVLLYGMVTKRSDMFSDLYVFEALGHEPYWAYIAGILCVLFAFFYYVWVPYKIYPGQTLGKKWLKIKIVDLDGKDPTLKTLCIRQILGLFLLESGAIVVGGYIRQMTTLALSFYVDYAWQCVGSIMMFASGVLVASSNSHRAIQDYMAKTKVVLE